MFGLNKLKKLFSKKEYLYHGTSKDRIQSIAENGLDPKYFRIGLISFTDAFLFARFWRSGKYSDVDILVKVDKSKLKKELLKKGHMAGELTYSELVTPKDLEIVEIKNEVPKFNLNEKIDFFSKYFKKQKSTLILISDWLGKNQNPKYFFELFDLSKK